MRLRYDYGGITANFHTANSASYATQALNSGSCLLRLAFIWCVFGSALWPAPPHHNHSLASDPISWAASHPVSPWLKSTIFGKTRGSPLENSRLGIDSGHLPG